VSRVWGEGLPTGMVTGFFYGQVYQEAGAALLGWLQLRRPAVRGHDPAGDGQPNPRREPRAPGWGRRRGRGGQEGER